MTFWLIRTLNVALLAVLAVTAYSFFLATQTAWLVMVGTLAVIILLWYLFAAQITVWLMRAEPMEGAPHLAPFVKEAEEYARQAGFKKAPRLYVVGHRNINAFAVGHPRNSAIIFTSGAFEHLRGNQLVAVLGHEYQHIKQHDSLLLIFNIVVVAAVRLAVWLIALVAYSIGILLDLMWGMFGGDAFSRQTRAGRSLSFGIRRAGEWGIWVVTALLMAATRHAEFRADAAGARLAGLSDRSTALGARWMISALKVLYSVNGVHPADNLMGRLYASHPPLEARVARLEALSTRKGRGALYEQGA